MGNGERTRFTVVEAKRELSCSGDPKGLLRPVNQSFPVLEVKYGLGCE
jgi:hypothetical protein